MKFNISTKDRAQARANMSPKEIAALANETRGTELSDEQLEGVSGGYYEPCEEDPYADLPTGIACPHCGSTKYHWHPGGCLLICDKCGEWF